MCGAHIAKIILNRNSKSLSMHNQSVKFIKYKIFNTFRVIILRVNMWHILTDFTSTYYGLIQIILKILARRDNLLYQL